MIDKQEAAIVKSKQDFNQNKEKILEYIKYVENWQIILVTCFYTATACDILFIVVMIVFLLKYRKTMQAMFAAFLKTNTKNTGIQSVQADQIGRTYPPLFTINLLKEEEILDDLKEISTMEYVVQVIMIIVCIAVVIIIMYFCCTKCRHTHTIFKYCFSFLPISCIVHTSHPDLFVKVTNITKGNSLWAPFHKEVVQIETFCCIFKHIRVNWSNIIITGISQMTIVMPEIAKVSIFMDNDLTHITDDHFKIKLIARLLDQIYVIQPPMLPPRYDDAPPGEYEYSQQATSTSSTTPSAPQFPEHLHSLLTRS